MSGPCAIQRTRYGAAPKSDGRYAMCRRVWRRGRCGGAAEGGGRAPRRAALCSAAAAAALLACAADSPAADVTSTWFGGTGSWHSAANWTNNPPLNPNQFPNNGNGGFTYDAVLNSGTAALSSGTTIQRLI